MRLPANIHHQRNLLHRMAVFPLPLPWSPGSGELERVNFPVTNTRPTLVPRQAVVSWNTQITVVLEIVNNMEIWICRRVGRRSVTFWMGLTPS